MTRCATCLLPETTSLKFNHEGRCALCASPAALAHIAVKPDEAKLEEMLEAVRRRGAGRPFDCVAAFSGGRDSTFMLQRLVQRHRLRCAAVLGKTLFTPVEIIDNARRTAAALGVTLVEFPIPGEFHRRVAAFSLRQWMKTRQPIFVNLACAPCKLVNREIFRWARKLRVKTVIYGGNRYEYFPVSPASVDLPAADRYGVAAMVIDTIVRLSRGARLLRQAPAALKYLPVYARASLLYVNQYSIYLRLAHPGIARFDYFHYADWDEAEVNRSLAELGWQLPPDCSSTWRADCVFEAVKNALFKRQLGYTYDEALYSNLIRVGKMTRDEALARLAGETGSERRLSRALDLIGIPAEELDDRNLPSNAASDGTPLSA